MKKDRNRLTLAAIGFLVLAGLGCTNPSTTENNPGDHPTTTIDLKNPSAVLRAVSFGAFTLPKSLNEETVAIESGVDAARSIGNVSTISELTYPNLKAGGFMRFLDHFHGASLAASFLNSLKTSPNVTSDGIALDTDVDVGTILLDLGWGANTIINAGKVRASQADDGQILKVFWTLSYPDTSQYDALIAEYESDQDFYDNGPRVPILIYLAAKTDRTLEMYLYSESLGIKMYGYYDPATNQSITVTEQGSIDFNLVRQETDGTLSVYSGREENAELTEKLLGFANDDFGGIMSAFIPNDDPSQGLVFEAEYYDTNVNLLFSDRGQTAYEGSVAPTAKTFFGEQFYVKRSFPLKNILPLSGVYASGYELRRKEGETYYSWKTEDGEWKDNRDDNTRNNPPTSGFEEGSISSWTEDDYWIEHSAYSGTETNPPDSVDTAYGDIDLTDMRCLDIWFEDPDTNITVKQTAPAYFTYGDSLPTYFASGSAAATATAPITAGMEALYADKTDYSASDVMRGFEAAWAELAPQFPAVSEE